MPTTYIDLSQRVAHGTVTTPGQPAATIDHWRTHADTAALYADGTSFAFSHLNIIGGTGTYMDAPAHRFDGGADITSYDLDRLVDVPGLVIDLPHGSLGANAVAGLDLAGVAVLVRTGASARFGSPEYVVNAPIIGADAGAALAAAGPAWVGIDGPNVDGTRTGERPVHTALLEAGIPIVEHLGSLDALPARGFTVTAIPLNFAGLATSPVRPVASVRTTGTAPVDS
ncbi:cyclase family protein [Demequina globuliformis]|uniref:cyclase family protein n=1 Tax=Demequina globuliformis TaxID=676202 RepID=UPI0007817355|nr:cyclase family protein [Demequina globuliformis]